LGFTTSSARTTAAYDLSRASTPQWSAAVEQNGAAGGLPILDAVARDDRSAPDHVREAPPTPVRAAGALVGLQALAATAFTVVVAARATGADLGP